MANPPSNKPMPPQFGPEDSFVGEIRKGAAKQLGETAPEVSQGAWRERAFVPRGTMSSEEMVQTLERAVDTTVHLPSQIKDVAQTVFVSWLPVLRQAIEQYGGDGLDAWLLHILSGKAPNASVNPFVEQLAVAVGPMLRSTTPQEVERLATAAIAIVKSASDNGKPAKLSFKQMERLLEGKLEVHELFFIKMADLDTLTKRMQEILGAMETLRAQLKSMPGKQPDGMYANFVRLKAEARVIDAELKHRATK